MSAALRASAPQMCGTKPGNATAAIGLSLGRAI
jgi:hypothetical protein